MKSIIHQLIESIHAEFPDLSHDKESVQYEWIQQLLKLDTHATKVEAAATLLNETFK
jgi:hypothetical protein